MLSNVKLLLGLDSVWIILVAALVALIIWILKLVTAPPIIKSVSLAADRTTVESGSPITFNGLVIKDGSPSPNEPLIISIVAPGGSTITSPSISTGPDGQYSYQYIAPVLTGDYTAIAKLDSGEESSVVSFTKITVRDYSDLVKYGIIKRRGGETNDKRTIIGSIGCSPRA